MSEPAKVRLVRCPKCENLLPELTDYSVYQCGGCGAVLRSKNKNLETDTFSEKSDEERVGGVSEKFSKKSENFDFSDKLMMNLSNGFENDVKSSGSSSSRADKREDLCDNTIDSYRNGLDKCVVNDDLNINKNMDELNYANLGTEFEEMKPQNRNANDSRRLGRAWDWNIGEKHEMEGFQRTQINDIEDVRYSTSKYSEEGPSNYHLGSNYGYKEPVKNRNDLNVSSKVEYLEQDRAELLRKLDELKDQLSRTCNVVEKPKGKAPLDRRMFHHDSYGGSLGLNRVSMQYSMPDKRVAEPPYIGHFPEPHPFMNRHEMAMHNYYPSMHTSSQVQGFGDPIRSQMPMRVPPQAPTNLYFSGQYMDNGMIHMDPFESYPHNINLHHPSCSCLHCYKLQQVPSPVPPTAFYGERFPNFPKNPVFYYQENPGAFGPREFANIPSLNRLNPQAYTRRPSGDNFKSEVGGYVRRRPPRVVVATGVRRCRPIAGGAPFITCYNCFELLQLPQKVLLLDKNQKKMRCEACSIVVILAVSNKKLVVSVHVDAKRTPAKTEDLRASMKFSSDDYDNSGYDFHSMERELVSSPSLNKSMEMRSLRSTSCNSEDEENLDTLNSTRKSNNSAELPIKANQDHLDYSNKYHEVNRFGTGNRSQRSERENLMPKKETSRQNSMKDSSVATEMEISSNEYGNTGISQDSADTSREEDQPRGNKRGESFFAGIIKKSFRDFSRSNQSLEQGQCSVTVNGHPISDRLIKKAEKQAGPIRPGEYWYDFRAGFWGMVGGPCLGIVPPLIEEFNYPMPENCAGGNTGVFVNGRELHQNDLNLLGSRGLPTEKGRSYIIEISGRVLDEDSGEEINSLGKLAPTIEKVKRGFGMKVHKAAA